MAKVGLQSWRKLGILYTNPCIDPDQALAESSGRWEQSSFDQTVVMTSSRCSNLPLKSGNSVKVPHGIMSQYVYYSMCTELFKGRICQFLQPSDPIMAQIKMALVLIFGDLTSFYTKILRFHSRRWSFPLVPRNMIIKKTRITVS